MSAERDRSAVLERAVRDAALALIARDPVAKVFATLAAAVEGVAAEGLTPRELTTAARQTRREEMLAELSRLEREGRGRAAVMLVARKFARNRLDPVEVASLARALRRWRKKNGQRPFPCSENE